MCSVLKVVSISKHYRYHGVASYKLHIHVLSAFIFLALYSLINCLAVTIIDVSAYMYLMLLFS